jgi:hypothetical protein
LSRCGHLAERRLVTSHSAVRQSCG